MYPDLSPYNRLMDWLASEGRFGDVVSLFTDLAQRAGHTPNVNTYRILFNACQRAGQAGLAMELFFIMKAKRVAIQQPVRGGGGPAGLGWEGSRSAGW